MKKYFLMLMLLPFCSFANSIENSSDFMKEQEKPIVSYEDEIAVDCDFRVIVANEDGTNTEYYITVHDVSWFSCKKMQLGAWVDRNF